MTRLFDRYLDPVLAGAVFGWGLFMLVEFVRM